MHRTYSEIGRAGNCSSKVRPCHGTGVCEKT